MIEDEEYFKLRNQLRNIKKIQAPENFEIKLKEKIHKTFEQDNSAITVKKYKLIPAFVILTVIILTIVFINLLFNDEYQDALQIEARQRVDILSFSNNQSPFPLSDIVTEEFQSNHLNDQNRTNQGESSPNKSSQNVITNYSQTQSIISKKQLNFMKPVTSKEEAIRIQILKQKLLKGEI